MPPGKHCHPQLASGLRVSFRRVLPPGWDQRLSDDARRVAIDLERAIRAVLQLKVDFERLREDEQGLIGERLAALFDGEDMDL